MVFISNFIKYLVVLTLLLCCLIQSAVSLGNNHELSDIELGDDLYETLPIQHHRVHHQNFRRASLRYHPHILYKKPVFDQSSVNMENLYSALEIEFDILYRQTTTTEQNPLLFSAF